MKTLVAIPHHFNPDGNGRHGALRPFPEPRIRALEACLEGLHVHLGASQGIFDIANRRVPPCNQADTSELDVAVCTTEGKHLLAAIETPSVLFRHVPTDAKPMELGYAARRVLKEGLGKYDMYVFLEDDLVIEDPLFLRKVRWFAKTAGDQHVLLPNRMESHVRGLVHKAYVDGAIPESVSAKWRNLADLPDMQASPLGVPTRFAAPANPHAGCFFLTAPQMERMAAQPWFDEPWSEAASFVGPLESAVTLPLLRTFRIYKPAPENASFLEIRHWGTGFLSLLRRESPGAAAESSPGD